MYYFNIRPFCMYRTMFLFTGAVGLRRRCQFVRNSCKAPENSKSGSGYTSGWSIGVRSFSKLAGKCHPLIWGLQFSQTYCVDRINRAVSKYLSIHSSNFKGWALCRTRVGMLWLAPQCRRPLALQFHNENQISPCQKDFSFGRSRCARPSQAF